MRAVIPILFALVMASVLAGFAPSIALAQGEPNITRWWLDGPARPAAPTRSYAPRQRNTVTRPRYPSDADLGLHMPDLKVAIPVILDENRPVIGVIGDSLAEALAFGFEADPNFKMEFALRQKTSSASGLVRADYLDWPKTLREFLSEGKAPNALIIMIGLNDRQILKKDQDTFEPLSEQWKPLYQQRVDTLLTIARDAKVPVIWVGLPVMRLPKLSTDLMAINTLIRDTVQAAGQTYVEMVDPFADSEGRFSQTGPDLIGEIVRLRGPDGIHFTPAGQKKLAHFVERPLRRVLPDRATAVASRPVVLPGIVEPSLPANPADGQNPLREVPPPPSFTLPQQESISFAPLMRARPDIGETRQLGERRTAERLVGSNRTRFDENTTRDLFERGLAPAPRAGRADDFSWR